MAENQQGPPFPFNDLVLSTSQAGGLPIDIDDVLTLYEGPQDIDFSVDGTLFSGVQSAAASPALAPNSVSCLI